MIEVLGWLFVILVVGLILTIPFILYLTWLEIKIREEELLNYDELVGLEDEWEDI